MLYHKESGQITAKLSGHSKALQRVLLHPTAPVAFTASDDHTVRLWRQAEADGPYQTEFILRDHAGPVRGLPPARLSGSPIWQSPREFIFFGVPENLSVRTP